MDDGYAIVGRIRKPHGIRGELVVEVICDEPDVIFASGRRVFVEAGEAEAASPARAQHEITRGRPFKDAWLVSLRGVEDREGAETFRDRYLRVPASELVPPGADEVWLHELPGMRVVHVDGHPIGEVRDVTQLPQGLLLEVATPHGTKSIPFVDAIVTGLDRAARVVTVDPPDGLLEL